MSSHTNPEPFRIAVPETVLEDLRRLIFFVKHAEALWKHSWSGSLSSWQQLIMIGLARFVQEKFYGHTLRDMLTDRDNPAMGLAVAGYFFGVVWTLAILLSSPSQGLVKDTLGVLLYGCIGIGLLTGVTFGTCRLFLGRGMHAADCPAQRGRRHCRGRHLCGNEFDVQWGLEWRRRRVGDSAGIFCPGTTGAHRHFLRVSLSHHL